MERSGVTLAVLIYVLLFSQKRIYGTEIEMKVRPGDNITLICDRPLTRGSIIVWIRNCSHKHQSSLIIDDQKTNQETFGHFSFHKSTNINSFDLHITNITVSDLGLYYCAEYEKKINKDENGITYFDVYYYGNQTTRLSLAGTTSSGPSSTVSPPPVSDHSLCWMLLIFSVCPVCVLFSSICVYCLCQKKTTGSENKAEMPTVNVLKVDQTKKHLSEMSKIEKFNLYSEVTYRLLPSAHP